MFFYEIVVNAETIKILDDIPKHLDSDQKREIYMTLGNISENFNKEFMEDSYIFVSQIMKKQVNIGVIAKKQIDFDGILTWYLNALEIVPADIKTDECTLENILDMIGRAENWNHEIDFSRMLKRYDLSGLKEGYRHSMDFTEEIMEEADREKIFAEAGRIVSNCELSDEINRIYEGKKGKGLYYGHPVHYLIRTDDRDVREKTIRILLQALHANDRVRSKRVIYIEPDINNGSPRISYLERLYKSSFGASVILKISAARESEEDEFAPTDITYLEKVFEVLEKYRNDVLTVICLPLNAQRFKRTTIESLESMSFVEISDKSVSRDRALWYMDNRAKEYGVRADVKLKNKLVNSEGYYPNDLRVMFDDWYDDKLKTKIFPQYRVVKKNRSFIEKQVAKGSAIEELMEMAGIEEVKKVIIRALDFSRAQKLFADKGVKDEHFSKHMVFTGNPGTAKTTVARLFARILKENDLIESGVFVEACRGDLVGKYVGWTAKNVQRKFKEASGGVLFIDEAYSLLDGHSGSFGDEAINTIVSEMENHRDSVIVIFAGYPDEMEKFLDRNPGLRSRIAYHVNFPDYETKELCEIASLMAKSLNMSISEEAMVKLSELFDEAAADENFGNGRFVRNIIEKSRMNQMTRLLSLGYDAVSQEDLQLLLPCDIEIPEEKTAPPLQVGFA